MKQVIAKTLFVIQPQSMIDVITNSSSELFIFQGKEKEVIEEMIKDVYPNYLDEYEKLVSLRSLSIDEVDNLLNWMTGSYCSPASKSDYAIPGNFTFDELYEVEDDEPAWNGELQYILKRNYIDTEYSWNDAFVTADNIEWVLNKLDPNNNMYLLYSQFDNPNWDMQEKLMIIGDRYHLG